VQRIAVEDRRSALLAAAVRIIGREGMGGASTRAIAAGAEMPTASFHYVFASYDVMVEQLVAAVLEAQADAVAEAVGAADTLRDFVSGALEGWLDRTVADPDSEIALHEIVAWSRSSPDRRHVAAVVYERYTASITSFVRAAEQRFGTRWVVPVPDVARFVLVLTDGVAARWLVDRDAAAARVALAIGTDALLALVEAGS
jgi:DNA-binding transcriptional regulator YbjK